MRNDITSLIHFPPIGSYSHKMAFSPNLAIFAGLDSDLMCGMMGLLGLTLSRGSLAPALGGSGCRAAGDGGVGADALAGDLFANSYE